MDSQNTGPGIDVSSTGPFAPPNDLSLEDYLRWLRIGIDLHTVNAAVLMTVGRPAKAAKLQDMSDLNGLQVQVDAALDRLSKDQDFLVGGARKVGESGFQFAMGQVNLQDPQAQQALANLRQKVSQAGGFVPMIEQQLRTMSNEFSAHRSTIKAAFDTLRRIGAEGAPSDGVQLKDDMTITIPTPSFQCAVGTAMVVHGAVLAIMGGAAVLSGVGAPVGAAAIFLGGAETGAGGVLMGAGC